MPRRARCVIPGVACHVTQRGVERRETFTGDADRTTYLGLLAHNLAAAEVRLLGWCLMNNHIHLIAVPVREDSLSVLLRRVHGRYAQYYNAKAGRSGHLWQNRYFACVLDTGHLWSALAYVERNPVRAGLIQFPA
jgi:REP-associated tyrosine transposase